MLRKNPRSRPWEGLLTSFSLLFVLVLAVLTFDNGCWVDQERWLRKAVVNFLWRKKKKEDKLVSESVWASKVSG